MGLWREKTGQPLHHQPQVAQVMGKKSRKNKSAKPAAAPSAASRGAAAASARILSAANSAVSSTLSADSFDAPCFARGDTPKIGWARELREAERSLRSLPSDPAAVMRAAKATRVMRQFDALEKIVKKADARGVQFDSADDRALWSTWKDEISAARAQVTRLREPDIAAMFDRAANEDLSLDTLTIEYETYMGLSAIQYAACTGDVQMLERAVALGAALDYEHLPPGARSLGGSTVIKPPGWMDLFTR
mmetsp:Transcript_14463/g.32702  ORF Transcript_14463/g.32702 Transcript_14463/m.32702 type:complete len:248 (-) Transcript_14463:443-1186(-)